MSMKELDIVNKSGPMEVDDEDWLDDEIQKQLSRIDPEELGEDDSDIDGDEDKHFQSDVSPKNEDFDMEVMDVIPSMEEYLLQMQKQTRDLETELEECDEVLHQADIVSGRDTNTDSYLEELAKEKQIPVHVLKQQILDDITKEEEQDNIYILGMADHDEENATIEIRDTTIDDGNKIQNNDSKIISDINSNDTKTTTDMTIAVVAEQQDMTVALNSEQCDGESNDEQLADSQSKNTDVKSNAGVVAEITEADLLEKALWKQLKSVEDKHRQREDVRNQGRLLLKEAEEKQEALLEERRREKQEEIRLNQEALFRQQQENEAKLQEDVEELRKKMESSMELHQREIEKLSAEARHERELLLASQQQHELELQQKQNQAATNIQRYYRGHSIRKQFGDEVKSKIEQLRVKREQQRIEELQKARQAKEQKEQEERAQKEKEAEMRQKEELEKKKAEEERKKQEEERKKQEEERKKQEEEKKIREQKLREEEEQKREEEAKKKLEEAKRKEEEERKRMEEERLKEAEKKQKEEEERRKREEIERKRREAEKARKEEEKREKEELERQKRLEEEMLEKAIKEQARLSLMEDSQSQKDADVKHEKIMSNSEEVEPNSSEKQVTEPMPRTAAGQSVVKCPTPTPPKCNDSHVPTARRSRQTVPAVRRSRAFLTALQPPQSWGEALPPDLNQQRLDWIKDCTSWSKVLGELRTRRLPVNKKPPRRPISGKMLPLLDKSIVLGAAKVSALQQVTTVELHDLPGSSIRTLAECPQLKSLVMQNCHLVTTDGIQMCKSLQYLDVQNNQIEVITCKDLIPLTYLNVSHNALASIHGLEGCTKLKYLNVSHNRITRLGGLDHLQSLHTFDVSHNQLITSKGLSVIATVQELNLSFNHLTCVDDLDNLGLLQVLNITGNTLVQVPSLTNQILLHNLSLNENNIADISGICKSWLPMLHTLSLHQNSITSLPNLTNLLLLEELDISDNQILEMESAIPGLVSLRRLKRLIVNGNPVTEENDWRTVVEDKLLRLEQVDDVTLKERLPELSQTKYERMCRDQLNQHLHLKWAYQQALSTVENFLTECIIHSKYYTQSYNLATEHRYSHEYGEISAVASLSFDFKITKPQISQELKAADTDVRSMKSKFDSSVTSSANPINGDARLKRNEGNLDRNQPSAGLSNVDSDVKFDSMLMEQEPRAPHPPKKIVTDLKQQSQSETVSMKYKFDAMLSGAANTKHEPAIQNTSSQSPDGGKSSELHKDAEHGKMPEKTMVPADAVGQVLKQEGFDIFSSREHAAATRIQALWRGYLLRKRLQYALNYARLEEAEDDDFDLEFGEVDLNAFNFNEDDLDKDWHPPDTPQLPNSHPVIKHPLEGAICAKPPHPPANPRQVWRGTGTPSGDHVPDQQYFTGGKPPLPPLSRLSNHTSDTLTEGAHTCRSKMSKKEEKITEEWGFKDSRTAELMIQRARKLKYNAVKKKKLGQLDPKQRLALFKKLQETTRILPVVPTKKATERREYFHARDEEEKKQDHEKYQEKQIKEARTYEWLHTQVGRYEVTSSRIQNREADKFIQPTQHSPSNKRVPINLYDNDNNLPRMDPNVLAGGRALLTGSPMSIELQSVDDGSQMSETVRSRRMSLPRTDSANDRFPPIKTGSAPSVRAEKMSWRSPDVNKSSGWGGGKKRGHVNH